MTTNFLHILYILIILTLSTAGYNLSDTIASTTNKARKTETKFATILTINVVALNITTMQ